MQKLGNKNASHPIIPIVLGFCIKHLILGMCEIKALLHKIITTLKVRNFVTNKVIKVMSYIKLGKVNLMAFAKSGISQDDITSYGH